MKKNLVFILCLSLIFILISCNFDKKADKSAQVNNNQKQTTNEQNDANEKQETNEVYGKVKLYEGIYFDDRRFGENGVKNYCEVEISNVTSTSFDFTVYEVNASEEKKESKKVIFLQNTAVFIGDGTKAAFYGKEYNLNFTFPNKHNAYIVATDMEISGFEPLEGKTYVNNKIPGHEFG